MANEKRLIDANALDDVLKDFETRYEKAFFALSAKAIANARQIVYAMKTVEAVEVVHGRWVESANTTYMKSEFACSVCGKRLLAFTTPYCPNCGAKMDGDGND